MTRKTASSILKSNLLNKQKSHEVRSSVTYLAPSGTANNVTFTFDGNYRCGRFINGDWWVAPNTKGGTVGITSITPQCRVPVSGKPGFMHGFQLNPDASHVQPFDNHMDFNGYNQSYIPVALNSDGTFASTLQVSGGNTLVKAVSLSKEIVITCDITAGSTTVSNITVVSGGAFLNAIDRSDPIHYHFAYSGYTSAGASIASYSSATNTLVLSGGGVNGSGYTSGTKTIIGGNNDATVSVSAFGSAGTLTTSTGAASTRTLVSGGTGYVTGNYKISGGEVGSEAWVAVVASGGVITSVSVPTSAPVMVSGTGVTLKFETVNERSKIQYVAGLTVLNEPLQYSSNYFRPAYAGTDKTLFSYSDIDFSRLPKYFADPLSTIGSWVLANPITGGHEGLHLDHISNFNGRYSHPIDIMPDYGQDVANVYLTGLIKLAFDTFDINNPVHKLYVINFIQIAIDLFGCVKSGTSFRANGGHMGGRKMMLMFGEKMFKTLNTKFREAINTESVNKFSEDDHTYYGVASVGAVTIGSPALFGLPATDAEYWATTRGLSGSRDARDPYGCIDGGGYEIGSAYHTQVATTYRTISMVMRMYGLESAWNWPAFFDYCDRWGVYGVRSAPDPYAPYPGTPGTKQTTSTYGVDFGNGILGTGRYLAKNNTLIDYDSAYVLNPHGKYARDWFAGYSTHWLKFNSQKNLPQNNSGVSSPWRRVEGDGIINSITNGQYQIAADKLGVTILTDWSSAPNTNIYKNQWIRINVPTGNLQVYNYSSVLTINGVTSTWTATTVSNFTLVNNNYSAGVGAWSSLSFTGLDSTTVKHKMLFAVKVNTKTTSTGRIFGTSANEYFGHTSSTALRLQLGSSGIYQCNFSLPNGSGLYMILVSIDRAQTTMAASTKIWVYDYNNQIWYDRSPTTGNYTTGQSFTDSGFWSSKKLLSQDNGGTNINNCDLEYFWWHSLLDTDILPDLTDVNVREKFNQLGSNGEGPLGTTTKPIIFFTGQAGASDGSTADTWNASPNGLANKGTISGKAVRGTANGAPYI